MSDSTDAQIWLRYAEENLHMARMGLTAGLYNPCLQNAQQAVEKALKAVRASRGMPLTRTHRIRELVREFLAVRVDVGLNEEDCDLLDSIYVSSKYPPESALPLTMADETSGRDCLRIADHVLTLAKKLISSA